MAHGHALRLDPGLLDGHDLPSLRPAAHRDPRDDHPHHGQEVGRVANRPAARSSTTIASAAATRAALTHSGELRSNLAPIVIPPIHGPAAAPMFNDAVAKLPARF